jgi:hypothetical protein
VKPQVSRTPRVPAPGAGGGIVEGGAAPGPKYREPADEAEATLKTRVAAEAEAGKTTGPTPSCGVLPGGEEGLCPTCREGEGGGEISEVR